MSQHTPTQDRQSIVPAGMEAVRDTLHYSPAVRAGRTVYVSGQIGRTPDMQLVEGREAQMVQAFENLRHVLEAAGARMQDIVDLTTWHTDMRDLPLFAQVRDRYFSGNYPAWTAVGAHMLCGTPGYIIEIKAIAVLPDDHA